MARRVEFLTAYQNAAYARQLPRLRREGPAWPKRRWARPTLTEAVARNLFKLMAYKDEYEVARLHAETGFQEKIAAMFEGDYKVNYHLAPPLIAKRNEKGELQKKKYGPAHAHGASAFWHSSRACAARRLTSLAAPRSGAPSGR